MIDSIQLDTEAEDPRKVLALCSNQIDHATKMTKESKAFLHDMSTLFLATVHHRAKLIILVGWAQGVPAKTPENFVPDFSCVGATKKEMRD
jgi:hypothetical protein